MTGAPLVVVLGEAADPPPGIEAAEDSVRLRYAGDAEQLAASGPEAEAVYVWDGGRERLVAAWPNLERLRWVQTA